MSKLHQPHGRADADTAKGELRKPDDYSNQPGQGGAYKGDGDVAAGGKDTAPSPTAPEAGAQAQRGPRDRKTESDNNDS